MRGKWSEAKEWSTHTDNGLLDRIMTAQVGRGDATVAGCSLDRADGGREARKVGGTDPGAGEQERAVPSIGGKVEGGDYTGEPREVGEENTESV